MITTSIEVITPEIAKELLATNLNNRNIRAQKVGTFAESITRGEWEINGESIKLDEHGNLIDGQHRLLAVIKANKPIQSLVVRGLSADTQGTMDQGTVRTLGDTMKWKGEKNASLLASTCRILEYFYREGIISTQQHSSAAPKGRILEFLENNPSIRDAMNPPMYSINGRFLTPSVTRALYYLFSLVDTEDANKFFELLGTGEGLAKGNPILTLRQTLESNLARSHSKMNTKYQSAITIKAFNAWRNGDSYNQIKWLAGGAKAEPYPKIKDLPFEPSK